MISSVLSLLLAASAAQASDTTRTAREAYTGCLRGFVTRSVESGMSAADFAAAFPQQCTAQEVALRAAVIRRESALRATRSTAEQSATDEIDEAKTNFRERFEMSQPEPAATPAAQPPAAPATPAATASATPQPTPAAPASTPQ
jgi:hypothetical protein